MIHFDSPPKRHARIEIIPMIDVMMFLLVFFVLISINVIPSFGVTTNLPSSSTTAKVSLDQPVIVTISKEGAIQVNGHETQAESVAAQVKELAKGAVEPQVIIKSDGEAVMQKVIDVMDLLRTGGISKVSIATRARTQG
ncbi:ExbD/TolR family protein [Uliginosibacterium gangwonense]|uniref:ExbD/TolR family protein n=1 Tax=Uliginosibacterium gangwonense TaxID=392736 RepID=UPI000366DA03|nr:biopolymer transporter ExbD [Uliginosibacterium gangwonense]